jgi:hypothetical protein
MTTLVAFVLLASAANLPVLQDCKMESGVTLDDLMNAWVHAYLQVQK